MAKKIPAGVQAFTAAINDYCRQNNIPFNLGPELSPADLFPVLDIFKAVDQCRGEGETDPAKELLTLFEIYLENQCHGISYAPDCLVRTFQFIKNATELFSRAKGN